MNNLKRKKRNSYFGYHFFCILVIPIGYLVFGGKVYNRDKIPKNEGFVFAGNHIDNYDPYLLCSVTRRPLHFIAKKELFSNFITNWFFNVMHLISVDRKNKNPEAVNEAIELLKEDKVVCIFPEGTYHKEDILLPFKPGAVDFAIKSDKLIVPFAIIGKYRFRSNPKVYIGDPLDVSGMSVEDANKLLESTVKKLILDNQKKEN